MAWSDFDLDTQLERDLLQRALPLVPTASDGTSTATIDLAANTANFALSLIDTLGATPASCVELLRIRPLLVGGAWKVLDLLLETALDEAGFQRDSLGRYRIADKRKHAAAGKGRPHHLEGRAWSALMKVYDETVELRHSLVHRRAHTDVANALIGIDDSGAPLRPLSSDEQEAFVRSVLRAAELVIATTPDDRAQADLLRQLGELTGLHGQQLPSVALLDSLPEIRVIIDGAPGTNDRYKFDLPKLRARQLFQGATRADLVVVFRDRPGQDLRGRLEDAPDDVVEIDPHNPPSWLH